MKSISFHYEDDADLFRQLIGVIGKLKGEMEPYAQVKARYPHLSPAAFTMRLKRFERDFPKEYCPAGVRIARLTVTPQLHDCLKAKHHRGTKYAACDADLP